MYPAVYVVHEVIMKTEISHPVADLTVEGGYQGVSRNPISHLSQMPSIAHPMRLPRRRRARGSIWHLWRTWQRSEAPFDGPVAPQQVCESRTQWRMNLKGKEPWKWPGTSVSVAVDSYIIIALTAARNWALILHVAVDSHPASTAHLM